MQCNGLVKDESGVANQQPSESEPNARFLDGSTSLAKTWIPPFSERG